MTADTSSQHSPLTLEEELAMKDAGYIPGPPVDGEREVSAAISTAPSSEPEIHSENSNSGSTPTMTVRMIETPAPAKTSLPDQLYSVATLEEMGFIRPVAEEIFSRWVSQDEQDPAEFIDYAFGHLAMLDDDKPPRDAMTALGITEELQEALTDPKFSDMFDSETLDYWLRDTMRMRFNCVDQRQQQVKRGEQGLVARFW
jgi:hypothetical protein